MTVFRRESRIKAKKQAIFQQIVTIKAWLNGITTAVRTTDAAGDEMVFRSLELIEAQVKALQIRLLKTGDIGIPKLDHDIRLDEEITFVKRVDDFGRVAIPKEIRRHLDISEGTPMNVYLGSRNEIVFKKYVQLCEEELVQNLQKTIEGIEKSDRINNHHAVMELLDKALKLVQGGESDG